jgi:hypothetical protein
MVVAPIARLHPEGETMDSYSKGTQGRQMNIRVLLVAEMTVRAAAPVADLNAKLNSFREAVLPSD